MVGHVAYLEPSTSKCGVALGDTLLELMVNLAHVNRAEKDLVTYATAHHFLHGARVVPSVKRFPDSLAVFKRDNCRVQRGVGKLVALRRLCLLDSVGAKGEDRISLRVGKKIVTRDKLRTAVGSHAIFVGREDPGTERAFGGVSGGVSVVGHCELRSRKGGVALGGAACVGVELLDKGACGGVCGFLLDGASLHLCRSSRTHAHWIDLFVQQVSLRGIDLANVVVTCRHAGEQRMTVRVRGAGLH